MPPAMPPSPAWMALAKQMRATNSPQSDSCINSLLMSPQQLPSSCKKSSMSQPTRSQDSRRVGGQVFYCKQNEEGSSNKSNKSSDSSSDCRTESSEFEVSTTTRTSSRGLWGKDQFPEGIKAHACWDYHNIQAAQNWACPCLDRHNCIGIDRIKLTPLLIHRKETQCNIGSNARDAVRLKLGQHYNKESKSFTRSFVVGHLNDCCAASAGLADGHSWSTWSRARADLRLNKVFHAGRSTRREAVHALKLYV